MASNGHKNFNFNPTSNNINTNRPILAHPPPQRFQLQPRPNVPPTAANGGIPNIAVPCLSSKVTSKTAKFVWEIKEISNIVKQKLWTVPKCKFSIGPYKWKLSLSLRDKENILYAKPELITPTDAEASYSLYLSVVNAQNYVLHSPQFLPDHPLLYDNGGKDSLNQHGSTWEVLRFNDGFVDLFSNYVSQDTLRIMVEMIVHVDNGTLLSFD